MHRFMTSRSIQALCALALVTATAAACSSSDSSTSASTGSGSAPVQSDAGPAAVLGTPKAATGTPVKIGLINAEGGAIDAPEPGDAAEVAAKYANDYLGGIAGHPIVVARCSDKSDNASAAACANKMVEDKVAAVVIGGAEPSADQIVPIIAGAGIPYVAAAGGAISELTTAGTFFWTGGALAVLGGQAQYAKDNGLESVEYFVLDAPTVTGSLTAIGKPVFDKAGVELRVTPVPAGTADPTSIVTAALASGPGAVSVVGDTTLCRSLLSALVTSGTTAPRLVNEGCAAQSVVDALGADALEGMHVFRVSDTTSDDPEAALYRAVMSRYAPKIDPILAVGGYQSMLGLVRAVNAAGLSAEPTPASIGAAIAAAKDIPLPAGHGIQYSCDHQAVPNPLLKGMLCSSEVVVTTMKSGAPSDFRVIDPSSLFAG